MPHHFENRQMAHHHEEKMRRLSRTFFFLANLAAALACQNHIEQQQHRSLLEEDEYYDDLLYSCGTHSPSFELKAESAVSMELWKELYGGGRRRLQEVITVPVYFHAIHIADPLTYNYGTPSSPRYANTPHVVNGMLSALAAAFDVFEFQLVGYQDVVNSTWFYCNPANDILFKRELKVGGKDTLNVYLCNCYDGAGASGWGRFPAEYERYPTEDGICNMNPDIKGTYQSNYQTLVHEGE
jgi:hypothetical protein